MDSFVLFINGLENMLEVYREQLPDSYLLVLREIADIGAEIPLERALHRAARSNKPAVWVDCSLCQQPSAEAVDLLLAYHEALSHAGRNLVLTHVGDHARARLTDSSALLPTIVPTLLDAARTFSLPT
ncbi:hypothetical protein [Hymenobacter sp. CRA2]|uniref:hypothetical protein n=1 Tax=Hymenobacter sp. CRA2 TaxID=1955620 RepID=UPI00098F59E3|nr:hypothetical protein [Hymenobacter sp. CRA2]OON69441.1 hypothetical protein B0919_09195 [Hymenobacter sp. CRA2]